MKLLLMTIMTAAFIYCALIFFTLIAYFIKGRILGPSCGGQNLLCKKQCPCKDTSNDK